MSDTEKSVEKWLPKGVTPDDLTKIVRKTLDTGNPLSAGMSLDEMLGKLVENRLSASTVEEPELEELVPEVKEAEVWNEEVPDSTCAMCVRYIEYAPYSLRCPAYDYDIKLCSQACLIRMAITRDLND